MISIENLHFSYPKKEIFGGLNLHIKQGYIYGLLGKNGTGKSTLLSNIAGLLFPGGGKIKVLDYNPTDRRPAFLQEIFMIPEEFYLPDISIPKFVKFTAPFYRRFNEELFNGYLKEFDIPYRSHLQSLSYGQKKKVLISFGLALNTSLLLMDEPTNGLDIEGKSQFRKIIAGAFDEKKSIIISSHQVKDLENLIDRVIILDSGEIVLNESLQRIASKLLFKITFDPSEIAWAFYSEPLLSGSAVVVSNIGGEESKIDLELLYKATLANSQLIQSIFKTV
jgi:ABC-2 type transport system ATP-binding protein